MKEEKEDVLKQEIGEDATLYGEYVSSQFHWIPPEELKRNAKRLGDVTEKKKGENKR